MIRLLAYNLFLIFTLLLPVTQVMGQGTDIQFGKNRVQVKEFEWRFYKSNEFDIYYYTGGENLARFTGYHASKYLEKVEEILDYRAKDRLVFMIYNSYADLRQTNIGYSAKEDDPNGMTPIVDNHAFIYFNGNHFDFMNQIKESIARVLLNEMMYGGSIQERVQNSTLLNLPDWYLNGLAKYIARPMTVEERSRLRSGILSGEFEKFQHLKPSQKLLISQSIWKYVANVYGKSSIANIVYLNRVNKSLESGFVFVLGKNYNEIFEEWYHHYRNKFQKEQKLFEKELKYMETPKAFRQGRVTQVKMSPDGKRLAYVTNNMGKTEVWVYDLEENDREKVYEKGYKTNLLQIDYNYPVIAWRPVYNQLTIVDDKKSVAVFMQYDLKKEEITEERKNFRVERVLDMSYSRRGRFIALSGINNGQSDIYVFNWPTNAMRPVTNDVYDDLHPTFADKGNAVVFSSNRASDSLRRRGRRWDMSGFNDNFDIFYHNYKNRSREMHRLTYTNAIDEMQPDVYDSMYFSYLTAENGIMNRSATRPDSIFKYSQIVVGYEDTAKFWNDTFRFHEKDSSDLFLPRFAFKDTNTRFIDTAFIYKDTAYTYALTNRPQDILHYGINQRRDKIMEFYEVKGEYKVATYPVPDSIPEHEVERVSTGFGEEIKEMNKERRMSPLVEPRFMPSQKGKVAKSEKDTPSDTGGVNINDYYFQSEFSDEKKKQEEAAKPSESKEKQEKQLTEAEQIRQRERRLFGRSRNYFLSFTPNYLQTQLDNSIINTKYLPFNQNNPEPFVYNPVLNAMVTMGISDLFQNYRITGGFRILGNLQGADYFMSYQNLKHRLDKKITFFRHGEKKEQESGIHQKELSHELRYELKWPFNERSSIRGDIFARRDNAITLSTERSTLEAPNEVQNWTGAKLEYVFDNTRSLGKNLKSGIRYKVYTEGYRAFSADGGMEDNTTFAVFGGDFRTYLPIFRDMIWANRLAFASSFGQAKVVYFMGGVDNWLFPKYNEEVRISQEQNYVYKALATNMRGFSQNIRNGNSYGVLNSELRIPLFKMFSNKPVISSFFKNFQLVGFGDIGSAWTGKNPFSEDNALNRETIENGPLKISVINLSNPIVGGYGVGIRTNLLGYFIRIDHAWGVENYSTRDETRTYISLGMDF